MRVPSWRVTAGTSFIAQLSVETDRDMTLTASRITEGVVRRFKRARRKLVHLNEAKIREALDSFGAFNGDVLLVHSSLSACGSIDGGPETVINALRSWITDRAALALPTHTWSYPDAT